MLAYTSLHEKISAGSVLGGFDNSLYNAVSPRSSGPRKPHVQDELQNPCSFPLALAG